MCSAIVSRKFCSATSRIATPATAGISLDARVEAIARGRIERQARRSRRRLLRAAAGGRHAGACTPAARDCRPRARRQDVANGPRPSSTSTRSMSPRRHAKNVAQHPREHSPSAGSRQVPAAIDHTVRCGLTRAAGDRQRARCAGRREAGPATIASARYPALPADARRRAAPGSARGSTKVTRRVLTQRLAELLVDQPVITSMNERPTKSTATAKAMPDDWTSAWPAGARACGRSSA